MGTPEHQERTPGHQRDGEPPPAPERAHDRRPDGPDNRDGPDGPGSRGGQNGQDGQGGRDGAGGQAALPLAGFTVGVTAARRAEEQIALLERRGATVVHAPAMRTVPLEDDTQLLTRTRELLAQPPDLLVTTTAVGFRGWQAAADGWGLGEELTRRFAGARVVARGPKARGAVRAAGLREEWSPESESMAEVLDWLLDEGVGGCRVALQLHGEPVPEFVGSLRAAGAEVVEVPVYRWLPPEDTEPLDRLLDEALAGRVHALTFTSAPAASSLLRHAERRGLGERLEEALRRGDVLAACVGPVTARPLQDRRVPTVQPERFRLAPLVQVLCAELPARARSRP